MTDEPATRSSQKGATADNPDPKQPLTTSEPTPASNLLTVTVETGTGHIVKIESVDSAGIRHELTDQQKAELAKEANKDTFEALIEQAFEAGIACMLGDAIEQGDAEEAEEDTELRHLLLGDLIKHSAAQRLMQREVLSRAILGSVIRQAIDSGTPQLKEGSVRQRPSGSAGRSSPPVQPPGRRHGASLEHRGG